MMKGLSDAAKRMTAVQVALSALQDQVFQLERGVESLSQADQANSSLAEENAARKKKLDELKYKIANMKKALQESDEQKGRKTSETLTALSQKANELNETCRKLRQERENQESGLDQAVAAEAHKNVSKAGVGKLRWVSKTVRNIALIGNNRAIPIEEPYFKFEWDTKYLNGYTIRYVSKANRVQEGEPVERALRDGGCIARILEGCDKESDYIKFWVCPDAILSFRRVAEEAKRYGLDFFWIPYDDKPIDGGAGSGGKEPMM